MRNKILICLTVVASSAALFVLAGGAPPADAADPMSIQAEEAVTCPAGYTSKTKNGTTVCRSGVKGFAKCPPPNFPDHTVIKVEVGMPPIGTRDTCKNPSVSVGALKDAICTSPYTRKDFKSGVWDEDNVGPDKCYQFVDPT